MASTPGVSGWSPSENSVADQLIQIFEAGGLSPAGAAGIVGNWVQESGLNPAEHGGLIAQWGGNRLTNEESYAAAQGLSDTSVQAEAGFALQELQGYPSLLKSLQTTSNPAAAALEVSNQYERPLASAANNTGREGYAIEAAQAFAGVTPTAQELLNLNLGTGALNTVTGAVGGAVGGAASSAANSAASAVTGAFSSLFSGIVGDAKYALLVAVIVIAGAYLVVKGLSSAVGGGGGGTRVVPVPV